MQHFGFNASHILFENADFIGIIFVYYQKTLATMELIEIISTILLFGGGLLIFVICVSFFLSRTKKEKPSERAEELAPTIKIRKSSQPKIRFVKPRSENNLPTPRIFQLEQVRPKEIKMIRRVTYPETGSFNSRKSELNRTNGVNNRYKIINEEQRKTSEEVVNLF